MAKAKGRPAGGDAPYLFQRTMLVVDALDAHEGAKDVFLEFGLPCFKCIVAERESIQEGCVPLSVDPAAVVKRLNSLGATESSVAKRRQTLGQPGDPAGED